MSHNPAAVLPGLPWAGRESWGNL